jgi:hypothetical protein
MVEHSKVNIHDLAAFGERTFQHTLTRYTTAGASEGQVGVAPVGKVGTSEALTFQAYYKGIVEALGSFLRDSPKGIEALGLGAVVMAANYKSGDTSQAKALAEVNEVFAVRPGRPSMASDKKLASKATVKSTPPRPENPSPSPTYAYEPPTPQQQIDEHNRRYGHYEHWQPGMGYPRPGT